MNRDDLKQRAAKIFDEVTAPQGMDARARSVSILELYLKQIRDEVAQRERDFVPERVTAEPRKPLFGDFRYEVNAAPSNYHCAACSARGVKLWREYMCLGEAELLCGPCTLRREKRDLAIDPDGYVQVGREGVKSDQIGGHIPAVPTEDGYGIWGYTSVPLDGCLWWKRLGTATPGLVSQRRVAVKQSIDEVGVDSRFAETRFVIEANSFEQLQLWKHNDMAAAQYKVKWEQDSYGKVLKVGEFGGADIWCSFFWVMLNGHRVLFVDPTSQVVDHRVVEDWLEAHCNPHYDNGSRRAHCDASNFHNCLWFVREEHNAY